MSDETSAPETWTASAQAAAIRARRLSASELLEAQFARVDRINPAINAIIWQDRDGARALARQRDEEAVAGAWRGPLHGVPITVKEAFDLVGSPSTWGDPAWRDNMPERDSDVVARYKAAGAIVFGKTNVPLKLADWQSFNEIYGATVNPWDAGRTPGGSSGGSGAALATAMSALEAGSDIGSSIRNPAHYCGVFGLKPSWNIVSAAGHAPPGWRGDMDIAVVGPMARSAEDLARAFDILAGPDPFQAGAWAEACPADPRDRLAQFTVAIKRDDPASPVEAAYAEAIDAFADQLERAGARVLRDHAPAIDSEAHFSLYLRLLGAAGSIQFSPEEAAALREALDAFGHPQASRVYEPRLAGLTMSHGDWLKDDNARRHARLTFERFFDEVDLLICPAARGPAFPHCREGLRFERMIEVNGRSEPEVLNLFWAGYSGVVGLPSLVGPMAQLGGLPVGYQAIGRFGADRTALAFARAVEREIIGFTPPPAFA